MSQPLWFNSNIKNHNNALILYTKAYECGIFTINDLIVNNRFATFEEIIARFPNSRLHFLKYYELLNLIPRAWKRIITAYFTNPRLQNIEEPTYNAYILSKKKSLCGGDKK